MQVGEERSGRTAPAAGAKSEHRDQLAPADLPFRDLREFLAQKKRSRLEDDEGDEDEGSPSLQPKKASSGRRSTLCSRR